MTPGWQWWRRAFTVGRADSANGYEVRFVDLFVVNLLSCGSEESERPLCLTGRPQVSETGAFGPGCSCFSLCFQALSEGSALYLATTTTTTSDTERASAEDKRQKCFFRKVKRHLARMLGAVKGVSFKLNHTRLWKRDISTRFCQLIRLRSSQSVNQPPRDWLTDWRIEPLMEICHGNQFLTNICHVNHFRVICLGYHLATSFPKSRTVFSVTVITTKLGMLTWHQSLLQSKYNCLLLKVDL